MRGDRKRSSGGSDELLRYPQWMLICRSVTPKVEAVAKFCIYCGKQVRGVRKGEHVIPEALGGTLTLKNVCRECNNAFSEIDKELVSKSPLNFFVWQTLGSHSGEAWEYVEKYDLVIETRLLPEYRCTVLWPQVVLDGDKPLFFYDDQEARQVGRERCLDRFLTLLRRARNTLRDGSKRPRWLWEQIPNGPRRGRYPPRVFAPHRFADFSDRMHFKCRYVGSIDKNRVLWNLDRWKPFGGRLAVDQFWGVRDPEFFISCRPKHVLRALVKIGINLLAHICESSWVNRDNFAEAVLFVCGGQGSEPDMARSGFVRQSDIEGLECPEGAHRFRITHKSGYWSLDSAFFSGKIGATVSFPGPNHESWLRAEVTVPINSRDWTIQTSPIVLPRRMRVEEDFGKVAPHLPITNVKSKMRTKYV